MCCSLAEELLEASRQVEAGRQQEQALHRMERLYQQVMLGPDQNWTSLAIACTWHFGRQGFSQPHVAAAASSCWCWCRQYSNAMYLCVHALGRDHIDLPWMWCQPWLYKRRAEWGVCSSKSS